MLSASEARGIAIEVNGIHDILCEAETAISKAAKEGKFSCNIELPDSYRVCIESAAKIIGDAGYAVDYTYSDVAELGEPAKIVYVVNIDWENAEL